jgi:ribosomal protein S18 acetylase RimI-like enzyme
MASCWVIGAMQMKLLTLRDLQWATDVLVAAFDKQLPGSQLFKGPKAAAKLRYFMECTCKYALLFGGCHAPEDKTAVALWLRPNATQMTPGRMFRAGMLTAPFHLGLRDFKAFGAFATHTAAVHQEALSEPHYYLFALGVRPDQQGRGVGTSLIKPTLERATIEARPIYLETQSPENVGLYERLGFAVVSDTPVPELDLRNFGMVRR